MSLAISGALSDLSFQKELKSKLAVFQKDGKPTANPNEALRGFFDRTADYWINAALELAKSKGSLDTDAKSLRRDGWLISFPLFH